MTREEAIRLLTTKRAQPSTDYQMAEVYTMAIKALEQEPRVDFKELKRKILMEVDGGTDDAWLAYGEVCNRISNSIDKFVADMKGEEE